MLIVENFQNTCHEYENFAIWAVENMDAFFDGNLVLAEVFEASYGVSAADYLAKPTGIADTPMKIIRNILEQVADKYFFIFTYHSDHHAVLVQMQESKIMNFGLDINDIREDHIYICIMDQKHHAAPGL